MDDIFGPGLTLRETILAILGALGTLLSGVLAGAKFLDERKKNKIDRDIADKDWIVENALQIVETLQKDHARVLTQIDYFRKENEEYRVKNIEQRQRINDLEDDLWHSKRMIEELSEKIGRAKMVVQQKEQEAYGDP